MMSSVNIRLEAKLYELKLIMDSTLKFSMGLGPLNDVEVGEDEDPDAPDLSDHI